MSSTRSILGLILAAAAWGTGTVISKRAVEEIAPEEPFVDVSSATELLFCLERAASALDAAFN